MTVHANPLPLLLPKRRRIHRKIKQRQVIWQRIPKGSFLNFSLVEELNESRIRVKHKKGPDGLKAFANIIRNFQGLSPSSQDLLLGFKSIVISNKKENFINLISRLADLSNTRHGDLSDFGANQWLKRIEEVRIILEDEGLLDVLCETA